MRIFLALAVSALTLGACAPQVHESAGIPSTSDLVRPHPAAPQTLARSTAYNPPIVRATPTPASSAHAYSYLDATGTKRHKAMAYKPLDECTTWNTAYAMHEMAGKYQCAALYQPGDLMEYRFVVFRDAHGLAYTTGSDGRWIRNPAYDGYVRGDQPHR